MTATKSLLEYQLGDFLGLLEREKGGINVLVSWAEAYDSQGLKALRVRLAEESGVFALGQYLSRVRSKVVDGGLKALDGVIIAKDGEKKMEDHKNNEIAEESKGTDAEPELGVPWTKEDDDLLIYGPDAFGD